MIFIVLKAITELTVNFAQSVVWFEKKIALKETCYKITRQVKVQIQHNVIIRLEIFVYL